MVEFKLEVLTDRLTVSFAVDARKHPWFEKRVENSCLVVDF